jgi:hypothetical protein
VQSTERRGTVPRKFKLLSDRQLSQLSRKAAPRTLGFDILIRPAHVRALVAEVQAYRTLSDYNVQPYAQLLANKTEAA